MENFLLRTRLAIENCESHLDSLESIDAYNTAIESYLTQHILVLLCADIQQDIYTIFNERAALTGDEEIRRYVRSSCEKVLRSVSKGDIASFIGLLGSDIKDNFNALYIPQHGRSCPNV